MTNIDKNPYNRENLTENILKEWQNLLNETADIFGVPAGLITSVDRSKIKILLSSETEGKPYPADFVSQYLDSGWFCEYTLKNNGLNLIPNALNTPQWKDNPASTGPEALHIVSYLGLPIECPDGDQFGTVCFIDNKDNPHNDLHIKLVEQIRKMIEFTLSIVPPKKSWIREIV